MMHQRRQHQQQFKFKVALEASKGLKTVNQIASENEIHPNQVSQWKKQLLEEGPNLFGRHKERQQKQQEEEITQLYEQIGRLKMELEWLKKKVAANS